MISKIVFSSLKLNLNFLSKLNKNNNIKLMSTSNSLLNLNKYKVFVTQSIPDEAIQILKSENLDITIHESNKKLTRDELLKSVNNCDALFCTLNEKIDKQLIQNAPNLKVIATCSVGYDHVDVRECATRNIPVGYTPGVLTEATAELAIGLLLDTTRRITEGARAAKNGEWGDWKIMWMCGKGLYGSNVGIFGLGRIGLAVAKRLLGFGTNKIMYYNRSVNQEAEKLNFEYVNLDKLLNESDFLICTCAYTKETEKIFNKSVFEKMKPTAVFINVSRGNVVNQDDLYQALKTNKIAAAGLDVTTPEPLPVDHELFSLNNCLIIPHIGSAEINTRIKMATLTARNIVEGLNNRPMIHQIKI